MSVVEAVVIDAAWPAHQAVELAISPNIPDTAENEMAVMAWTLSGPKREWAGVGCLGDDCPLQVVPGARLSIGVTAATGSEASATVSLDFRDLSVTVSGVCD